MTPSEALGKITERFKELSLKGNEFTVEVRGVYYRMALDTDSFVVYRINHCKGNKHHVPGWPVCVVTKDAIFEECFHGGSTADHCSCDVTIEQWLEIIGDRGQ